MEYLNAEKGTRWAVRGVEIGSSKVLNAKQFGSTKLFDRELDYKRVPIMQHSKKSIARRLAWDLILGWYVYKDLILNKTTFWLI